MVLLNLGAMPAMVEDLTKFPMLIVLAGYAAFVPGLAIVHFHNRWVAGWPVLITVFGWLSVVIGFARIVFPRHLVGLMHTVGPALHVVLPVVGAVFLLAGAVLTFKAFADR